MSTYYFLVCDECMESCHGASNGGRFAGKTLGDSEVTLRPFMVTHAHHKVRILVEDAYYEISDNYIEWNKENIEHMKYEIDRDRGLENPDRYNRRIIRMYSDEPEGTFYKYTCSNCGYVRPGLLDSEWYSTDCPQCGGSYDKEKVNGISN